MFIAGVFVGFVIGCFSFLSIYGGVVVREALQRKPLGERIGA